METKRNLNWEEYLKLKGLRAIHDDLIRSQENIWSAVETILEKIVDEEEIDHISGCKEYAVDSMHWKDGLDGYLENRGIEVEKDE